MELLTCLPTSKDVEFQDVYYRVTERKNYIKVTGIREILHGVSGCFRNGELTAIMGPSGAGKSSLLNAISGYKTAGVTGHIKINRNDSCYITQEDHHQSLLTVEELMKFACDLKLTNLSREEIPELITEILNNLHLNHRRKTLAEHLSGGERKRLSIALELVSNPSIFFLDEPTSGLDEVTAAQCIRQLHQLAKQGHTIVITIHQPSARVLNYFDRVFVLALGQCVYQGGPGALIPYLHHVQLDCPKYYSPSDYIIELCDGDEGKKHIPILSEIIENGKLIFIPPTDKALDPVIPTPFDDSDCSKVFHQALTTLFIDDSKNKNRRRLFNSDSLVTDGTIIGGATALYEHMKAISKRFNAEAQSQQKRAISQFWVLLNFMFLRIIRARTILVIQLLHHILCGLCFGLIFYKLGNEGSRMYDHLKFCIGSVLMIVYTQVMVPILSYPSEVKVVKKHTFNRWYTLTPYYMAVTVSRMPLQFLLNMVFLAFNYWMTGLPHQWWRFGLFSLVIQLTSLVAEGMGLAIGATFSITNGSAVGPLLLAPFLGLAIYGFDFASEIPAFMNFIMKLSYVRVSVVALVMTVFGYNRPNLECNEIYCHFANPRALLRFLDIEKNTMEQQLLLLCALLVFFRVLFFLSLKSRCGTT